MTQAEQSNKPYVFNPNEHIIKLKGKDYLEVRWRMVWFRDKYPQGIIKTSIVHLDIEKGLAVFKAEITDGEGGHAEGHGSETSKDFGDYIEKAETKAIGRGLAALGYGTQFAPELEEGERIVDSPVSRSAPVSIDVPTTKSLYEQGGKKGLWKNAQEFYATASHMLSIPVGKDTKLSVEERTALAKQIADAAA